MKCALCKKKAIDHGVCKKHEVILRETGWQPVPIDKCKIDNCDKTAISLGLCLHHYKEHRKQIAEECSFTGCNKKAHTKGLCKGHYGQQWQGQELRPLREGNHNKSLKCNFEGCNRRAHAKGLCAGHYKQQKRNQELRPLKVYDYAKV